MLCRTTRHVVPRPGPLGFFCSQPPSPPPPATEPPPPANGFSRLYARLSEEKAFFWGASKVFFRQVQDSVQIFRKTRRQEPITRAQFHLFKKTRAELTRCLPVLMFTFLLPGSLPVAAALCYFCPSLFPSAFRKNADIQTFHAAYKTRMQFIEPKLFFATPFLRHSSCKQLVIFLSQHESGDTGLLWDYFSSPYHAALQRIGKIVSEMPMDAYLSKVLLQSVSRRLVPLPNQLRWARLHAFQQAILKEDLLIRSEGGPQTLPWEDLLTALHERAILPHLNLATASPDSDRLLFERALEQWLVLSTTHTVEPVGIVLLFAMRGAEVLAHRAGVAVVWPQGEYSLLEKWNRPDFGITAEQKKKLQPREEDPQ
eukprot:gnl/Spiro4/6309_TR3243_c0_g2_i1.p1 gnl/Spiro4/6309_TR3243_c0_g2~~gnl/Spiro4/6309_TR3243_c0_g2_i1.p1  ORF type:complete len:378 (-),score=50.16 gnl/Spiro4/6309_TR3243_c0_g2_i1:100-1209(-)